MIHFAWPWAFLILPLPLLIRWLLPGSADQREAALLIPFAEDLAGAGPTVHGAIPRSGVIWLAGAAWILLVVAAARPQWLGEPVPLPVAGRDLLLAVDLSGSMQAEDFIVNKRQVNRLVATKIVAGEFIERRSGDRLGLLLFGDQPYLQVPLTFDRKTVRLLLEEAAIGLAGEKTAIGDGIGLAVKRLQDRPAENRVLILLTDGANTAGTMEPKKAAELAATAGVTIYAIGIGADEMVVKSLFGSRRVNPAADLDEDTLKAVAAVTGGKYFRARDTKELEEIYGLIDDLEPVAAEEQFYRPRQPLFFWPLGAALCLGSLVVILWRRP